MIKNLVQGTYVMLYRSQQDPLGGDRNMIPKVKSVGVVIAHRDRNTFVRFHVEGEREKHAWWVSNTNLKRITKQEYDDTVAAREAAHAAVRNVDRHQALVGDEILAKPAAPAPVKEEVVEDEWADFKAKAADLVSFEFNGTKKPRDICFYAAMRVENFTSFHLYMAHKFKDKNRAKLDRYLSFLVNESHFKDVLKVKDLDRYYTDVVPFHVEGQHKWKVLTAAVLLRHVWEFSVYLDIWCELVDGGVNPHAAMLVATMFRNGSYSNGDGHSAFYILNKPTLFIEGNFNEAATSMYEYNHSSHGVNCKLKVFFTENNMMEKNEYGYYHSLKWDNKLVDTIKKFFEELK